VRDREGLSNEPLLLESLQPLVTHLRTPFFLSHAQGRCALPAAVALVVNVFSKGAGVCVCVCVCACVRASERDSVCVFACAGVCTKR
jgi:hypothetical protein